MRSTYQILDDVCIDCCEQLEKLEFDCEECPVRRTKKLILENNLTGKDLLSAVKKAMKEKKILTYEQIFMGGGK